MDKEGKGYRGWKFLALRIRDEQNSDWHELYYSKTQIAINCAEFLGSH